MIGIQFKMYSAVGRYRKNSYGGDSNAMGFEREGFSSMSAKIFLGEGMRYPNPVLTALNIDYGLTHGSSSGFSQIVNNWQLGNLTLRKIFAVTKKFLITKFDYHRSFSWPLEH